MLKHRDYFTKTGSGQTQGKQHSETVEAFLSLGMVPDHRPECLGNEDDCPDAAVPTAIIKSHTRTHRSLSQHYGMAFLDFKMPSFYRDRLGTHIGRAALKKRSIYIYIYKCVRVCVFVFALAIAPVSQECAFKIPLLFFVYCAVDYSCYAMGLYVIQRGGANLMVLTTGRPRRLTSAKNKNAPPSPCCF